MKKKFVIDFLLLLVILTGVYFLRFSFHEGILGFQRITSIANFLPHSFTYFALLCGLINSNYYDKQFFNNRSILTNSTKAVAFYLLTLFFGRGFFDLEISRVYILISGLVFFFTLCIIKVYESKKQCILADPKHYLTSVLIIHNGYSKNKIESICKSEGFVGYESIDTNKVGKDMVLRSIEKHLLPNKKFSKILCFGLDKSYIDAPDFIFLLESFCIPIRFYQNERIYPSLESFQHSISYPYFTLCEYDLNRVGQRVTKRMVDILGGFVGLLISIPIICIFGIIIFTQSPGPIFYKQRRSGKFGKEFILYKLRSMKLNAEQASGAVWASENDQRRLRIGSFMRKYNIDEIPQFYNVLVGEMSLVGPRPERPELIKKFVSDYPTYRRRLMAKPANRISCCKWSSRQYQFS